MTIYVKVNDTSCVNTLHVRLCDIAAIYCKDEAIQEKVKELVIFQFEKKDIDRKIFSILFLIQKIQAMDDTFEVENLGSSDCIVYFKEKREQPNWVYRLKVGGVSLIAFFGASFSIMAYNTDVGIEALFFQIYALVMGENPTGPNVLHVSYSIGLAIGILIFFNHAGKMKLSKEPTPFQIQMKLYERDVNDSIVMEAGQSEEEENVDS